LNAEIYDFKVEGNYLFYLGDVDPNKLSIYDLATFDLVKEIPDAYGLGQSESLAEKYGL
jgi:hypothetical protein